MDKKGGQAFPRTGFHKEQDGMTLRDYFAAKAMPWVASDLPAGDNFQALVAKFSYKMADAMLAERNK
jgi:hypothetical protein